MIFDLAAYHFGGDAILVAELVHLLRLHQRAPQPSAQGLRRRKKLRGECPGPGLAVRHQRAENRGAGFGSAQVVTQSACLQEPSFRLPLGGSTHAGTSAATNP